MNKSKLQEFIQHYEKVNQMDDANHATQADILIKIDSNQKIKMLLFKIDKFQ